jgi:methyl-accepting chemotaxis protein
MRLTVARKLWVAFGIVLVLLAAVAVLAVISATSAATAVASLAEIHGAAEALDRGVEQLLLESTNVTQYIMTKDERYQTAALAARNRYNESWVIVRRYGDEYGVVLVDQTEEAAIGYHDLLDESVRKYGEAPGEIATALAQLGASEYYLNVLGPVRDALYGDMQVRVETVESSVAAQLRLMRIIVAVAGVLAIVIAVVAAFLISRGITQAARDLAAAAESISRGDLDVPIEVKTGDEMQDLAESIERMRTSLKAAIERLRRRPATA